MKGFEKDIGWIIKEKHKDRKNTRGLKNDIERLKKGEPVDYIIGFVDFLGCKIDLSLKPFIPRPETEHWAKAAIEEIKKDKNELPRPRRGGVSPSGRVLRRLHPRGRSLGVFCRRNKEALCLDLFAGSGCIGVSLLKNSPKTKVHFADKNKKCLEQIKRNLKLNKIAKERYKIINSDIFSRIKIKYDYILANPPYVPKVRKSRVQKSVLNFEPEMALFGGRDGSFYIKKFLKTAKNYLADNGTIYMEFDLAQKKDLARILKEFNYKKAKFFKDQYGRWRYLKYRNLLVS